MVYVDVVFLFFTLFVMWTYLKCGVYSRAHRMLPLMLAIIVIFDFYQIVKIVTEDYSTFHLLEDLLLLQTLYCLWAYAMDYHSIKMSNVASIGAFVFLGIGDVLLFELETDSMAYIWVNRAWFTLFMLLLFGTVIYANVRYRYSRFEQLISRHLLLAMAVPIVTMVIQKYIGSEYNLVSLLALVFTDLTFLYLILTGKIIDTKFLLNDMIIKESGTAIVLFDAAGAFVGANTIAAETFGNAFDMEHAYRKKAAAQDEMTAFLLSHNDGDEFEYNGRYYRVVAQNVEFRGIKRGFTFTLLDITDDRKKLEFSDAQTKLKAQFLARASHDLRSPLHAIIGVSEMLLEKELSMKNRQLVSSIHMSGNTLIKIVNSILDYSKLEAGALEVINEKYDIVSVVEELVQVNTANLSGKNVDFTMEFTDKYPQTLIGDKLRVTEMMQNILSNAVKFTQEGEIKGKITITDAGDRYKFAFSVKDTGPGMSKEKLASIFEEYASFASEQKVEGTGLGMTIVKEFAKFMGGDAWADSDGSTGSEIGFYIYQGKCECKMLSPEVLDVFTIRASKQMASNVVYPSYIYPEANVLLADDMEINRQIFEKLTEGWKFTLDKVENGVQAIECVKKKKYDLIILDMMMPVMGGDEAVVEIKKLTTTPVLLLSANVNEGSNDQYFEMGFDGLLAKPLDMKKIKAAIEDNIPAEKRQPVLATDVPASILDSKQLKMSLKAYTSYREELKASKNQLEDLFNDNLAEFQIRVHGLKGISRQMGYDDLGTLSEIMEMASKSDHTQYIADNLDSYLENIGAIIDSVNVEISEIEGHLDRIRRTEAAEKELSKLNDESAVDEAISPEELTALYDELKKAFDQYDAINAERILDELDEKAPKDDEELLEKLRGFLDSFDYEEAATLISERR